MPAMGTVLAGPAGEINDDVIAYYSERAAGGTGLIITEVACVENNLGKATGTQIRIDEDVFIPGLSRLAGSVKKYGARIFVQLHHAGNQSNSSFTGGKQIVAPSPVTNAAVGEEPRELSTDEVDDLVARFVTAGVRAKTAGMDGVELHGAHGYLINEFLSPHTNRRTDRYGGSFENRMRFAVEIINGIKQKCGNDYPVCVRFSADEFTGKGIDLEEGKRIAGALESAGADALNVSCGTYESMPVVIEPIMYKEGWRTYLAKAIREVVSIPVIGVGAIKRPTTAEKILRDEDADFIAIGRGLLSDPEWVNKAADEQEESIIPCIGCMHCIDTIFSLNRIQCAVNARAGREREFQGLSRDGGHRRVAVIGAGPAGLEAARVLSLRGFEPKVYERREKAGGELVLGCQPPDKEPIEWYRKALVHNVEKLGIEIETGIHAEPHAVSSEKPYAVFVAIGGKQKNLSNIPGLEAENVVTALDVLESPEIIKDGEKVIVIGGGMTGCETVELIRAGGAAAMIVEMLPELAQEANSITRASLLERLNKDSAVEILTGYKLSSIRNGTVTVEQTEGGEVKELSADKIVLSLGLEINADEIAQWKKSFDRVTVVGDAVRPSDVAFAVRTAFDAAYVLR